MNTNPTRLKRHERSISESGEDLCNVCHEVTTIFAVGECDHPVCYRCSTRMRVLCDQMYCAICRADLPKVAFTKNFTKFGTLELVKFKLHQKHKIFFENEAVKSAFFELQEHRCTACPSRKILYNFYQLVEHMKRDHRLFPCQLCVDHIKVFSSERKFYDRQKLGEHRRKGDTDDKSHKGHPLCKFCDERYFDNDELVRHLRKDHYYCHFCDSDGISNAFYSEYENLREHFLQEHYLCEEEECARIQFTNAFRHDLDYKAHKAAFHSRNLKKAMVKAVRTLDIDINLAPREAQSRGRGRRNQGVISRNDFEDVAAQDGQREGGQTAPFGKGKDFKRERRQNKVEADEFQRAITASLNAASSVRVVDPALLNYTSPDSDNVQEKDSKFSRCTEDFPTLGGDIHQGEKEGNSDSDSERKNREIRESLSKKVARAKGFSVQHGRMDEEDFPSLGGFSSSVHSKPNCTAPDVSKKSNIKFGNGWTMHDDDEFPGLGGGGGTGEAGGDAVVAVENVPPHAPSWKSQSIQQPPKKYVPQHQKSKWVASSTIHSSYKSDIPSTGYTDTKTPNDDNISSKGTDFPSLSSIGSFLSKSTSSSSASDKVNSYQLTTDVKKSNIQVVKNKPTNSPPIARANQKPKSARLDKKDFPSLGSSSSNTPSDKTNTTWGAKIKEAKRNPPVIKSETVGDGILKLKVKNKKNNLKQLGTTTFEESSSESVKSNKSNKSQEKSKNDKSTPRASEEHSGQSGSKSNDKRKNKKISDDVYNQERVENKTDDTSLSSSSKDMITTFLSKGDSTGSASDALNQYASQHGVSVHKQTSNVHVVVRESDLSEPNYKASQRREKSFNKEIDFPSLGNTNSLPTDKATLSWGAKTKVQRNQENTADSMLKIKSKSGKKKGEKKIVPSTSVLPKSEELSVSVKCDSGEILASDYKYNRNETDSSVPVDKVQIKSNSKKSKQTKNKSSKESSYESSDLSFDKKVQSNPSQSTDTLSKNKSSPDIILVQNIENNTLESSFPSIHESNDDESSDLCLSISSGKMVKGKTNRVNVMNEDDFPSLARNSIKNQNSAVAPPPGFSESKLAPPPGFSLVDNQLNSVKPPPGFSSSNGKADLSDIASMLSNNNDINKATDIVPDNSNIITKQIDNTFEYIKPEDFQSRNFKLINDITNLLKNEEEKFSQFKMISREFRQGMLNATDYYTSCSEIIGAKSFDAIFAELLVLLPDIKKQQQLLVTYNDHQLKAKKESSLVNISSSKGIKSWDTKSRSMFTVCQVCQQVVSPVEYTSHLSEHNLDSDFPELGSAQLRGGANRGNSGIKAK